MSNYALGAIQMLTPSTFRRRNVSSRNNVATGSRLKKNNSSSKHSMNHLHNNRTIKRRNTKVNNKPPPPSSSNSTLPNTLTFYEQKNGTSTLGGSSSSSCGNNIYPMSQLTMSQLSDSKSNQQQYYRSFSNQYQNQNNNRNNQEESSSFCPPSKVARTKSQNRPSVSLVRRLQSDNASIWSSCTSNENGEENSGSNNNDFKFSSNDRARAPNDNTTKQQRSTTTTVLSRERLFTNVNQSQSRHEQLEFNRDNGNCNIHGHDHDQDNHRQLKRSQNPLPFPASSQNSHNQHDNFNQYQESRSHQHQHLHRLNGLGHATSTSDLNSKSTLSMPAPSTNTNNRKRSWMEACIDVMKTPYRKGKSIAYTMSTSMTKPKIKVDIDDDIEIQAQTQVEVQTEPKEIRNGLNGSNDKGSINGGIGTPTPASFETPYRNDHIRNEKAIVPTPNRGTAATVALTSAVTSASNNQAKKVLDEAKEILKKIEEAKADIENERKELQSAKLLILQEIQESRNETKKILQEKRDEVMNTIQKEAESTQGAFDEKKGVIQDSFDEKKNKFDVHFWSAEEKMNDKFREFNIEQKEALDEIKSAQEGLLSDVKVKEETLVRNLEARLSSLVDEAGRGLLNEMEDKRNVCGNILKEVRNIPERIEPSLRTSLKASLTVMIEDEKRKLCTYLKKEVHWYMKGRSSSQGMTQVESKESIGSERQRDSTVQGAIPSTTLLSRNSNSEKVRADQKSSKSGAKRVSPIHNAQVSYDEFAKGEEEHTVGASPPQENLLPSSDNEKFKSAAAVEVVVEDDSKNENFKCVGEEVLACAEDANSSLPPSNKDASNDGPVRETTPNPIRRYNLRSSNNVTSSRVGILRSSKVEKHISNDRHRTAKTKRLTTKKLVKSQPTSQKKVSQQVKVGTSTSPSCSQSKKENSSTDNEKMTVRVFHTPTQTPKKVISKQRIRRRRRIGDHKVTAKHSSSSRSKDNAVSDSSNSRTAVVGGNLRTSRSSLSRNRLPSNSSAFRSPSYTLPNASSRTSNQRVLREAPSSSSPSGVDSIFGPPPIPTLDGLTMTRSPTTFIAPRRSFMSNFDFDTLSFQ